MKIYDAFYEDEYGYQVAISFQARHDESAINKAIRCRNKKVLTDVYRNKMTDEEKINGELVDSKIILIWSKNQYIPPRNK